MRTKLWLCLTLALFGLVTAASAQHADTRQQWQPQTDQDPRLEQTVHVDIIGRAVVGGLPVLSEKTGVKLEVAPENRDSLGERKFTLLAREASLRAIMLQLCNALQDCHWDIDVAGPQPVYLLHEEPGAAAAVAKRREEEGAAREEERSAARNRRIEEARARP